MSITKSGKLTIHIDCGQSDHSLHCLQITLTTPKVSPYSWFGFTNIQKFRPLLDAHGIEVDILPFFLGGAREAAGNPFVPTPQWKQAFASQDSDLTGRLLGLKVVAPEVFPISSLFVSLTVSC